MLVLEQVFQVTTQCGQDGRIRVSYADPEKLESRISRISTNDRYRSYLNLTAPSDEESGDESLRFIHCKLFNDHSKQMN